MQLGTRWAMGGEPPARLPEPVVVAIRDVESSDAAASPERRWTLTWLEGRPIVELDPPDASEKITTIQFNPAENTATISFYSPGDEWVEE